MHLLDTPLFFVVWAGMRFMDEDDMAGDAGSAVLDVGVSMEGLEATGGVATDASPAAAAVAESPPVASRTEARVELQPDATRRAVPDPQPDEALLNWRNLAEAEYRDDPVMKKYDTVGAALKALVHNERMLGNSIQIPREGAGETQWRTIFEKLGCPKNPGEYTISDPDMGKDEAGNAKGLAPNFLVSLLDVAHKAGLNNKQAQEVVDFAARTVVQSEHIQAGEMAMQKAQAERTLYEAFAGDAASMIQKATMAISRLGEGRYGGGAYAQRAAEKWRTSPLGNDVDMVAMLANLWDNFSEGEFITGGDGSLSSKDALEADVIEFGKIMNNEKLSIEERKIAQDKQLQAYRNLNAMTEAAARRQNGFR